MNLSHKQKTTAALGNLKKKVNNIVSVSLRKIISIFSMISIPEIF